ncbi:hypothetical protein DM02DRAFT_654820 [Periconia macrospinosa]|uniref:S-adenosyl-L-methionine-dependent methyltransferase n=1 Tax=Periconia macrospinosa TaxID=97972 RepID=A0A2V1DSB2_9PLEO|nr:hypothetical protein DM02DRAFT_654820 [Periconia macrospinosa]
MNLGASSDRRARVVVADISQEMLQHAAATPSNELLTPYFPDYLVSVKPIHKWTEVSATNMREGGTLVDGGYTYCEIDANLGYFFNGVSQPKDVTMQYLYNICSATAGFMLSQQIQKFRDWPKAFTSLISAQEFGQHS